MALPIRLVTMFEVPALELELRYSMVALALPALSLRITRFFTFWVRAHFIFSATTNSYMYFRPQIKTCCSIALSHLLHVATISSYVGLIITLGQS